MKTAAWLLLLAIGSRQPEMTVDMLELNHIYNLKGDYVFSQTIAWNIDPGSRKYHVAQWWPSSDSRELLPVKNALTGNWEIRVSIGRVSRKVKSPVYRESWTHIDPEWEDKQKHPLEDRIPVIGK